VERTKVLTVTQTREYASQMILEHLIKLRIVKCVEIKQSKSRSNITEETAKEKVRGKMKTKGYDVRGHSRPVLTLGGKEETAEAHSSTSLRELFVGDGGVYMSVNERGGPRRWR